MGLLGVHTNIQPTTLNDHVVKELSMFKKESQCRNKSSNVPEEDW